MDNFIQALKLTNALKEESYTPQQIMNQFGDTQKPAVVYVMLVHLTKQERLRYDVGEGYYSINETLDEFNDLAFSHLRKVETDISVNKLPY